MTQVEVRGLAAVFTLMFGILAVAFAVDEVLTTLNRDVT